jgi:hypothetical protein
MDVQIQRRVTMTLQQGAMMDHVSSLLTAPAHAVAISLRMHVATVTM